jgi:predicted HTH transcriptional regulator
MGKLEKAVVKSLAAFLNSRGGRLLIGVADTGEMLGIEADFTTLRSKPDRDGWRLAFTQAVSKFLGSKQVAAIDVDLVPVEGVTVAVATVRQAPEAVWLKDGDSYEFYVRSGPSSVRLDAPDAVSYIRENFWM